MGFSRGGLIAAVQKRRRRESQDENSIRRELNKLREPHRICQDRLDAIDDILEDIGTKTYFGPSYTDPAQSREATIDGLLEKVNERIERSTAYRKLLGTAIFFISFVWMLFLQRDISAQFEIERSILNGLIENLPSTGSGGYTNSNAGSVGVLQDSSDFYAWFSSVVIKKIFSDPVCGDGICDAPDEYAGFGRFGCSEDCGLYLNVTTVQLDMQNFIQTSGSSMGWDFASIPMVADANKGQFKFNVYSEAMQDFLFKDDQNATSVSTPVPDGKYTLVLYQTQKTSSLVESQSIAKLGLVPSTLPLAIAFNDFAYGVPMETLTWSLLILNGITTYCFLTSAYYTDPHCADLYIPDVTLRIISSYGLSGTVSVVNSASSSVEQAVNVQFCSALPNLTGGTSSLANKEFLKEAQMTCPQTSSRRRVGTRRHLAAFTAGKSGQVEEGYRSEIERDRQDRLLSSPELKNPTAGSSSSLSAEAGLPPPSAQSNRNPKAIARENEGNMGVRAKSYPSQSQAIRQSSGYIFSSTLSNDSAWWVVDAGGAENISFSVQTSFPSSSGYMIRYGAVTLTACACVSVDYCLSFPCYAQLQASGQSLEETWTVKGSVARLQLTFVNGANVVCITWGGAQCPSRPAMPRWVSSEPPASTDCSKMIASYLISLATETQAATWTYTIADCAGGVCTSEPSCSLGNHLANGTQDLAYNQQASKYGSSSYIIAVSCLGNVSSDYLFVPICIYPAPILYLWLNVSMPPSSSNFVRDLVYGSLGYVIGAQEYLMRVELLAFDFSSALASVSAMVSLVCSSNTQAVNFRNSIVKKIGDVDKYIKQNISALSSVAMTSYKIDSTLQFAGQNQVCHTHYDCYDGFFCSKVAGVQDRGICDRCNFCIVDTINSYNGVCPADKCPGSGGYPECMNATKFLERIETLCSDSYQFEVWKYGTPGNAPTIIPAFTPKLREVTPYNRMVGAVVVSQRRRKKQSCVPHIVRQDLKRYTQSVAAGISCPSTQDYDGTPYGYDPAFMPFSSIYNGKLRPEQFYSPSERHKLVDANGHTSLSYPMGFFPHQYNQNRLDFNMDGMLSASELKADNSTPANKNSSQIVSSNIDTFKLYFDERLTQKQAEAMVRFAQDGKFIDSQTSDVTVEFVTFNAVHGLFAYVQIFFTWDSSGNIAWDYQLDTFDIDGILYPSPFSIFLMIFVLLCLCINCLMEVQDVLTQARKFALKEYILDPFNWIDWLHFFFMWGSLVTWAFLFNVASRFAISEYYPILFYGPKYSNSTRRKTYFEAPIAANKPATARFFRTLNQPEYDFLLFINEMQNLAAAVRIYSGFAGVSVVLFIFRLLKSLHFQERMGMVTRTIHLAAVDLFHFVLLFIIVLIGYAIVGFFLFGQEYEGMRDFGSSAKTLAIFLVNIDTTQFYASMEHAGGGVSLQVFLWSYLFIAYFILVNIFLAILVDAYATVKEGTDNASGLLTELSSMIIHGIWRRLPLGKRFISDQKFKHLLSMAKSRVDSKIQIKQDVNKLMSSRKAILVPGNLQIDKHTLQRILRHNSASVLPEDNYLCFDGYDDEAIFELIERYGTDMSTFQEQKTRDLKEFISLENMRRLVAMNLIQNEIHEDHKEMLQYFREMAKSKIPSEAWGGDGDGALRKQSESQLEIGSISLTIFSASNLPKMDVIRKSDPYCVAYVDGEVRQDVYMTKTVNSSLDPTWNENFKWALYQDVTCITIAVWDRDNVTADDLIGTCFVDILDMAPDETSRELELSLENPRLRRRLLKSRISVRVDVNCSSKIEKENPSDGEDLGS